MREGFCGGIEIVVGQGQGMLGQGGWYTRGVRYAEGERARAGLDQ
jgi:hypothetical protein